MKRSEINTIMENAVQFFKNQKFYLPKFAYWSVDDWKSKGKEIEEIIKNRLGWDITDYGSGDFSKKGLIHFTIRNGNIEDLNSGGKPYCEKIMIVEDGQEAPMHFHYDKMEDIINRGGGVLAVQLYNSNKKMELDDAPVMVSLDGTKKTFEPGSVVELYPGDSITLPRKGYHKFWAKKGGGKVMIGEVSTVNDDYTDNHFLNKVKRFTEIEEDEEPLYLLYDDYQHFVRF
ncbi:MAG: D-lyxose/D-mannose family sugar isomerase [Candidatus Lokiarchaeota archaeon]|nr:D-lyxose/D-mannose family sugar isomerase [Candidatus Lokiarchaeota archaeon]